MKSSRKRNFLCGSLVVFCLTPMIKCSNKARDCTVKIDNDLVEVIKANYYSPIEAGEEETVHYYNKYMVKIHEDSTIIANTLDGDTIPEVPFSAFHFKDDSTGDVHIYGKYGLFDGPSFRIETDGCVSKVYYRQPYLNRDGVDDIKEILVSEYEVILNTEKIAGEQTIYGKLKLSTPVFALPSGENGMDSTLQQVSQEVYFVSTEYNFEEE